MSYLQQTPGKFSYDTQIRFSDTDASRTVSPGGILDLLQDCTNLQSEVLGVGVDYQFQMKRAWMLSGWQVRIRGQLMIGDIIKVSTWAKGFERLFASRAFSIYRGEECIVEAESDWFVFDMENKRIARIEERDSKFYPVVEEGLEEGARKKVEPDKDATVQDSFIVRNYHLDLNQHVNNAWYVKIAGEYLKKDDRVTFLRVEYRKAAKLHDILYAKVKERQKQLYVEFVNESDATYATVIFEME